MTIAQRMARNNAEQKPFNLAILSLREVRPGEAGGASSNCLLACLLACWLTGGALACLMHKCYHGMLVDSHIL